MLLPVRTDGMEATMEATLDELARIKKWNRVIFGWKMCMRVDGKGFGPCYLHVGEGAGQGAGTRPPLLLQSSAQHLKLPLLLPHRGQQGGRTCTLLHSHAESREQDRTGQGQPESRVKFNQHPDFKGQTESPKHKHIKSCGTVHTDNLMVGG